MAEADWLRLQKKIFSRYVYQKLREVGIKREIKDVVEEMKDGELLIDLVQALSGKDYGKRSKPGAMRVKQIDAVNNAIKYIKDCGVDLSKVKVQAEDFVDGNQNVILAVIFQIILKYLKFEEDEDHKESIDVREALTLWLKNKTEGYKNIEIKDFGKSFHNGLPFLALIHRMRPKLVDYDSLHPDNKQHNLEVALNLGEKYLGIEKYITADEIPKLNELSMIVYLSDWYNGVSLLQKQDIAARRIGKLVDLTELHDKMRADYTAKATSLREWLHKTIDQLNERKFDDTLKGILTLQEAFYAYKKSEKAERIGSHLDANSLFNNLAVRLHNHKRPAWVPGAGLTPKDLDAKFVELEEAEIQRAQALQKEHARQVRLHKLGGRYTQNVEKLKRWTGDKDAYLNNEEKINSVEEAEDALESLGLYDGEFTHVKGSALKDLTLLHDELVKERYEKSDVVKSSQEGLLQAFSSLEQNAAKKRSKLEATLQAQKDLDDSLYKEFANSVKDFTDWLKGHRDNLASNTDKKLEEQLADVQKSKAENKTAESKLAAISGADEKVKARHLANNPYTNVTKEDAHAQWQQFEILCNKKAELLEEQIAESKRGGLTEAQIKEIEHNFQHFDKDKNGFLSKRELRTCLQSLGEECTPKDLKKILEEYDKKNAGHVTREEFERFMRNTLGDTDTHDEIIKSFKYLSYDRDVITGAELTAVVNDRTFTDHHVSYLGKELPAKDQAHDFITWTRAVFDR
jgi:Ca2+-binding EF-hand superfamily protein